MKGYYFSVQDNTSHQICDTEGMFPQGQNRIDCLSLQTRTWYFTYNHVKIFQSTSPLILVSPAFTYTILFGVTGILGIAPYSGV